MMMLLLDTDVISELRPGKDGAEPAVLAWAERTLGVFDERILSFDSAAARECATKRARPAQSDRDSTIAAVATVNGMTVATHNVRHFEGTGVALMNPWTFDELSG